MSYALARFRAIRHVATANAAACVGRAPWPRAAHLVPTWRCNLRCRVCTVWKRAGDQPDLPLADMLQIVRRLRCLDIVKVIGGEPFMYEEFAAVGHAIRKEIDPYIFQIISNGTLTERIVDFVRGIAWPGLHLRLSVDGLAARHADMRVGQDDGFERVMNTLESCARLRREKNFVLGVNFNLTTRSAPDLPEMARRCEELGVDLIPGIPVSPFLEDVDIEAAEHRVLEIEDPEVVREALVRAAYGSKKGVTGFGKRFLALANDRIFTRLLAGGAAQPFGCREMRSMIYVFPQGDIVLCGLRHLKLGNLVEHDLPTLWRSPRAEELRRAADTCPGCNQAAIEIVSRLYGFCPAVRARRLNK
ncbi:MAG: radical SAM protein [Candidatus Lernaella stagnicola]|nr:radical SAM protein [Candidatus Lernaella stagnicola]